MKLLAELTGSRWRLALLIGAIAFAMATVIAIAARAQAAENVYWDNYLDEPATIAYASVDGPGGGLLNLSGLAFESPEGMAYDPVTNRLYIAGESTVPGSEGEIVYVNLDGSGAGVFSAPGATMARPEGVAIDSGTRTIYWTNTDNSKESIAWAKLDGSAAGTLNTTGAPLKGAYRIALDPGSGRVFWSAVEGTERLISWASVNNTGGGILTRVGTGTWLTGLAANPVNKRLYALTENATRNLSSVSFEGGTLESAPESNEVFVGPYGLAVDPVLGKAYWGNDGQGKKQEKAIGYSALTGGSAGTISPATARVAGAQDPVIIKSPTGTGAPTVTQFVTALSCSQGTWAPDYPGAYVYQAPISYTYQWSLNGVPISATTGTTYNATTSGSYTCTVTGTNPTGTTSQTSGAVTVTPATLSLKLQTKKPKAKAGKTAKVKLKVANRGQISSPKVEVCGKLDKKAMEGLKAPKCVSVKGLAFGGSAVVTLKVPTKKSAEGTYKFSAQVKGTKVKAVKVSVKVTTAKPTKK